MIVAVDDAQEHRDSSRTLTPRQADEAVVMRPVVCHGVRGVLARRQGRWRFDNELEVRTLLALGGDDYTHRWLGTLADEEGGRSVAARHRRCRVCGGLVPRARRHTASRSHLQRPGTSAEQAAQEAGYITERRDRSSVGDAACGGLRLRLPGTMETSPVARTHAAASRVPHEEEDARGVLGTPDRTAPTRYFDSWRCPYLQEPTPRRSQDSLIVAFQMSRSAPDRIRGR